jgi:hypothetical protein
VEPETPLRELLALISNFLIPGSATPPDDVTASLFRPRLGAVLTPERRAVAVRALEGAGLSVDDADINAWLVTARQITARATLCATGSPAAAAAVLLEQSPRAELAADPAEHQALLSRTDFRDLMRFAVGGTLALLATPEKS